MRLTLGPSNNVKVVALMDDRMNNKLATFGSKGHRGISMKIRFECPNCHKTWTSLYGNTQWYYKLEIYRSRRGRILGCTLSFKVHTYA